MDTATILSHVDHTLLKPEATWEQIKTLCDEAMEFGCATVCIPPSFVKQAAGETEYDSEIIESIEREAQTIGNTGKKGGGEAAEDAGSDPKLRDALEIATESGKISTSLLQRRLSIGYGRAAKIIDIMEARGFVSAPDGQKPREVLISKTQYREMVVNNDERLN